MNPTDIFTVDFSAESIRLRLDTEEAFWMWLADEVEPTHFERLRREPLNMIRQIYSVPWSAHLDGLVQAQRDRYIAPYRLRMQETIDRVRHLAGLNESEVKAVTMILGGSSVTAAASELAK
jgi:hypothetical protein